MLKILQQFAAQLSSNEKLQLLETLKALIAQDFLAIPNSEPVSCPRCGCKSVIRKGKSKSGTQRFLCKGCAQTFGHSTLSVLGQSKLAPETWFEYARCMLDGLTLRQCAKRCHISLPTSWFARHRLCELMGSWLPEFRTDTRIQIDSTYINESFSGNHHFATCFEMPRVSRKSGSDMKTCGISSQKVCVICGINDFGDVFCEMTNRGREDAGEVKECLKSFVSQDSVVATDSYQSYKRALTDLKVAVHKRLPSKSLAMVNALHSRLKEFLIRFHGVSSRRLQNYLDWFCWIECFKGQGLDRHELLLDQSRRGHYQTTWSDYFKIPYPFMDYWDQVNSALT